MNSPMLEAFLKQQKFTDKQADAYQVAIEVLRDKNFANAMTEMTKTQEVKKYMEIPSKIKPEDINQKTEAHPKLKSYDHSLEAVRLTFKSKDPVDLTNYKAPKDTPVGTNYEIPKEEGIGIDWGALAKRLGT